MRTTTRTGIQRNQKETKKNRSELKAPPTVVLLRLYDLLALPNPIWTLTIPSAHTPLFFIHLRVCSTQSVITYLTLRDQIPWIS